MIDVLRMLETDLRRPPYMSEIVHKFICENRETGWETSEKVGLIDPRMFLTSLVHDFYALDLIYSDTTLSRFSLKKRSGTEDDFLLCSERFSCDTNLKNKESIDGITITDSCILGTRFSTIRDTLL